MLLKFLRKRIFNAYPIEVLKESNSFVAATFSFFVKEIKSYNADYRRSNIYDTNNYSHNPGSCKYIQAYIRKGKIFSKGF